MTEQVKYKKSQNSLLLPGSYLCNIKDMNTPESITTSLHWSKELQKAGWPQDCALFYWVFTFTDGPGMAQEWQLIDRDVMLAVKDEDPDVECCAAPTAEELTAEILKRTGWAMALFLGSVASLMHNKDYKGTLADFLAEVFCNSLKLGTIPPSK